MLSFLIGCKHKQTESDIEMPYKVFASDFDHNNSKDICLAKEQLFHKNVYFLRKEQDFVEITEEEMVEASKKLIYLIDSCQNTNSGVKPKSIDNYFRQYIGYKEKGHSYIYINLCAFYNERFTKSGLLISDCYLNSVLSTPERGYAGHVIVNMDEHTISEYHFEKYPEP